MIELLAVIAIIAILFIILIPQISNAIDKSRETGIMMDFRDYERAAKTYFIENKNSFKEMENFNKHLDKTLTLERYGPTEFYDHQAQKKNPYGQPYVVIFESENNIKITTKNDNGTKNYILYIYYFNEEIKSRTVGFDSKDINSSEIKKTDEFEYRIIFGEEVEIVGYIGKSKNITIPNKIENLPVTTIASSTIGKEKKGVYKGVFENLNIDSIVLPQTIYYIGDTAFRNNNLKSVDLPNDLLVLGRSSLRENNIESIILPNKLTRLTHASLAYNQIKSINIPNEVKNIETSVFLSNSLSEVSIPKKVELISTYAFTSNPLMKYKILGTPEIKKDAFPSTAIKE